MFKPRRSVEMIDKLPLFYQKLFLEIRSWLVGVALTEYWANQTASRTKNLPLGPAISPHVLQCVTDLHISVFLEATAQKWYGQNRTGRTARSGLVLVGL